ncbi:MAG: hypothetical protein IPK10_06970 [Bacteroidetes bacterium]|nr:hypothetical protein [Bacteroidota bacterium]
MLKKTLIIYMLCVFPILTSCSNCKVQSNIITCNFDELKNWNVSNEAISNKLSRSGKYSIFVGSERIYSLTYDADVKELLAKGYTKLKASIWANTNHEPQEIQWVATIDSPTGGNYIWKSTFLSSPKETDNKGWKRIEVILEIPLVAENGILKIYGWSPAQEEAFLTTLN